MSSPLHKKSILDLLGVEVWAITLPNQDLILEDLLEANIGVVTSQLEAKRQEQGVNYALIFKVLLVQGAPAGMDEAQQLEAQREEQQQRAERVYSGFVFTKNLTLRPDLCRVSAITSFLGHLLGA